MIEKELIEHKVIIRLPLFIALCGLVLGVGLMFNNQAQHNFFFQMEVSGDISEIHQEIARDLNSLIFAIAGTVSLLLTTLFLPKTLRKERQEGSSMFWRSMPVSNHLTHAVKLAVGLVIIPLICALLVLFTDVMLWLIQTFSDKQLALLVEQQSIFYVLTNWLAFLARMLLVSIVLLPLAMVALAISQIVNSPLLVMFIGGYAIKWLSLSLFASDWISKFLKLVVSLPIYVLFEPNPFRAIVEAPALSLVVYVAIGIIAYLTSVRLNRTEDVTWRNLFQR
jgi:ABC-2 type transport system permease protein